jgi:predicted dehydrogenase
VTDRMVIAGFAGQQGREYLPLLAEQFDIVGGVDLHPDARALAETLGIPCYSEAGSVCADLDFEVAAVFVPHRYHFPITAEFIANGKHVLKEKPFAIGYSAAKALEAHCHDRDVSAYTLVQRRFNPTFRLAATSLHLIGKPLWFTYDYHLAQSMMTSGWRSEGSVALGGVLLDMGYHAVDIVTMLFGDPASVSATLKYCFDETSRHHLEDLAVVHLDFGSRGPSGMLTFSRHHWHKTEALTIFGSDGVLTATQRAATVHRLGGADQLAHTTSTDKFAVIREMIGQYRRTLRDPHHRGQAVADQVRTVRTVDRIYASARLGAPLTASIEAP